MNIFIHRRDLRIQDNITLNYLNKKVDNFVPIFIFNPEQIYPIKNPYFSNNLVQFLCESLIDLKNQYKKKNINLFFFEGETINVLDEINSKYKINSISFNRDYSPFSKTRDKKIENWCQMNNIEFFCKEDMLLSPIDLKKSIKSDLTPYVVFTPFKNNLLDKKVDIPIKIKLNGQNTILSTISLIENIRKYYKKNPNVYVKGSRKNAQNILSNISNFDNYDKCRNFLIYKTTYLSAYINLGLVSIREVYWTIVSNLSINHGLINELYWREFYYNILNYFPHIVGNSYKKKYENIKWENNMSYFNKWKLGKTGFPIVDACMRQLNTTGHAQ